MRDRSLSETETYVQATSMLSVAMTDFPKIGQVVDQIRWIAVPVPRPKPNEIAIKLAASAMHKDEIYAAQGTSLGRFFGPKTVSEAHPYVMGSSVVGTVVAIGDAVTKFAPGDSVIVIPNHLGEIGSWATYRCVAESMVMLKPTSLSHVQAAALTMASCVAWAAINHGNVRCGDRCLVVGASGAVGIMMVQILHSMGAVVTGVCSGANDKFVQERGAKRVIDYTKEDFGNTGQNSFDRVFDALGGYETEQSAVRVLTRRGRFVTVVGPQRYIGETKLSWYAFSKVLAHILWRVVASRLRGPRYIFGATLPKNVVASAMAHIVQYDISMPIEAEVPFQLDAVKDAVTLLISHRTRGRIVINFDLPC